MMLKSVRETQKLFSIEGIEGGQINIKTSDYLLSLPEDKQVEVLTLHLENLKNDFSNLKDRHPEDWEEKGKDIDKTQLSLLIQVIEGLLSQM